jgi:hypothetical protein
MNKNIIKCLMGVAALTVVQSASAAIFTGSAGNLSAEADFSLLGNTLTVILKNTSLADVNDNQNVLTGVFFNTGLGTLSPSSASLNGSSVYHGSIANIGNGWEYKNGLSVYGYNAGIGASGLGSTFGHANFGDTVAPQSPLGGVNYGIVSAGYTIIDDTGGFINQGRFVKNSVRFELTVSAFDLSSMQSVVFQYGSQLTEGHFTGTPPVNPPGTAVPEPSTYLAGISALGMLCLFGKRNRK